jgi:prepilin-type N-terminal cleavage/methylation domain-containing protein
MRAASRAERPGPRGRSGGGFTLIEILIVISIIAVLASLILGGVTIAKRNAYKAMAKTTISNLSNSLERYVQDTGRYPGTLQEGYRDEDNAFPALYEALFGLKPPQGKGGPSAPYGEVKEADVAVVDEEDPDRFRKAVSDEIYDHRVKKYLLDPWGEPFVYRENKTRPRRPWMHGRNYDIYSKGPDRIDQTIEGERDGIDDIGSW